ncbi:MAG: RNA-binding domain-containing protein [Candidatus Anammoxibacter sp.]
MDITEFEVLLNRREDSRLQFKKDFTNAKALALELVAFSNALGGQLLIGVDDSGNVSGLSGEDINRLNQLLSNASSENTVPPVYPLSEVFAYGDKKVMIVTIPYSAGKPFATKDSKFVTKAGADKRMISNDEMRRLYQESGKMFAEETPFRNGEWDDIDSDYFIKFYKKKYGEDLDKASIPKAFENLNLASHNIYNLAGALLFGVNDVPRLFLGNTLLCVSFFGNDLSGSEYRDSKNIEGNLQKLYEEGRAFIARNLKCVQNGRNFNSIGDPEIPLAVIDELLINALLHRDFFISSNIRIMIFDDRIEIVSPGKLPNHLTVEKVKSGVSIKRNPTLCSFAFDIIPYRGLGSGILRAFKLYPHIELINNEEVESFKVIITRPSEKTV